MIIDKYENVLKQVNVRYLYIGLISLSRLELLVL